MNTIIEQPECRLLDSFESRSCDEITELEVFKDIEYVIIRESNHRLGGKFTAFITFCILLAYQTLRLDNLL